MTAAVYLQQLRDHIAKHGGPPRETEGAPGCGLARNIRRARERGVFKGADLVELKRLLGEEIAKHEEVEGEAAPGASPEALDGEGAAKQSAVDVASCAQAETLAASASSTLASSSSLPSAPSTSSPLVSSRQGAPSIFTKSIERLWCHDVADGNKFFESVANHKRFHGVLNPLQALDFLVIMETESGKSVVAVGRVKWPQAREVADRRILYNQLLPERRRALDEKFGDARSFNYVMFDGL